MVLITILKSAYVYAPKPPTYSLNQLHSVISIIIMSLPTISRSSLSCWMEHAYLLSLTTSRTQLLDFYESI